MRTKYLFVLIAMLLFSLITVGCTKENEALQHVDFVVEVEEGREPIVLQLSDTQIIDSAQARSADRISQRETTYWATDQVEECCYDYLTKTIAMTSPDLILITGDVIYGEFDDSGRALTSLIEFMESFEIPWAPVFGNHDNESKKGVDWQCDQFENAEHCLFKQRELTGNGNYTVGIVQGGVLKRVFFMLDSNGCGNVSAESLANGHTTSMVGFGGDQIEWYTDTINQITELSPDTKHSMAFHIQPAMFATAFEKYGYKTGTAQFKPINIDNLQNKEDGDFGYLGAEPKSEWDSTGAVWNTFKQLGVDSVFVGHEHFNSASVVYDGIRCQYGQKSSTYDQTNFVDYNGNIIGSSCEQLEAVVGGTVIPLSEEDGSIIEPYIYYYKK